METQQNYDYFDRIRGIIAGSDGNIAASSRQESGEKATNIFSSRFDAPKSVSVLVDDSKQDETSPAVLKPSSVIAVSVIHDEARWPQKFRMCHLVSFLPFTRAGGVVSSALMDSAKAALMAVHHFNNGIERVIHNLPTAKMSDSLGSCNIRFTIDFYDTERSPAHGFGLLSQHVLRRGYPYEPTAILGAARSAVSSPLAILSGVNGIPQISHASTSSSLDDKDLHPTFGRVVPSTNGDARAAVDYLRHINANVTHFAILYVRDDYGTSYRAALQRAAQQFGITADSFSFNFHQDQAGKDGARNRISDAIDDIKATGYRYIVAIVFQAHFEEVMLRAASAGIAGPDHFWLMGDGLSVNDIKQGLGGIRPGSPLETAIHGIGVISGGIDTTLPEYHRFLEEWRNMETDQEFKLYFEQKKPLQASYNFPTNHSFSWTPSHFPPLMYDSIMSLGMAACEMEDNLFDGRSLYDGFVRQHFVGASGIVNVEPETGSRDYRTVSFRVRNVVKKPPGADGFVKFDVIDAAKYREIGDVDNVWSIWEIVGTGFIYSDGSGVAPSHLPPPDVDYNWLGTPFVILGISMCAFVMLASIIFGLWTFFNRNSKVVRASQPMFLIFICVGTATMGSSYIPTLLGSLPTGDFLFQRSCMMGTWLFTLGFATSHAAILSKTWRIIVLLQRRSFRRVSVSATRAVLPALFVFGLNVTVLVIWQITSPLTRALSYTLKPEWDRFGRPVSAVATCVAADGKDLDLISTFRGGNGPSVYFMLAILLINGLVIVFANVQAFRARGISTEYSESRYIGLSTVSLMEANLILLPVLLFFRFHSTNAFFLVQAIAIFWVSAVPLLLIFVPKVKYLRHAKWTEKARRDEAHRIRSSVICSHACSITQANTADTRELRYVDCDMDDEECGVDDHHGRFAGKAVRRMTDPQSSTSSLMFGSRAEEPKQRSLRRRFSLEAYRWGTSSAQTNAYLHSLKY